MATIIESEIDWMRVRFKGYHYRIFFLFYFFIMIEAFAWSGISCLFNEAISPRRVAIRKRFN